MSDIYYSGHVNAPSADIPGLITPKPSIPARYHRYSTDEQIVGEWIDGKPVYERTFTDINPKSGTTLTTDVDEIVDWRFRRLYDSNSSGICISDGNYTTNMVYPYIQAGALSLMSVSSSYSGGNGIFIVQYTKTTDTASNNS